VRVPLILAGPGVPAGAVVRTPVSLIDVAPTLLDLLGLPPAPAFEGRSLVPLLHGGDDDGTDLVLQLPRNDAKWDLRTHTEGLVRGAQKLLVDRHGRDELFHLDSDPGERAPQAPPAGAALRAALATKAADLATRQQPEAQKAVVDEATKEKLRALGYNH
jgi:arylsulfatase A-like enzyme